MVLSIALSISDEYTYEKTEGSLVVNMSQKPYVFDHTAMLRNRDDILERYENMPNMWKIEKRSNLSVDEFWDLYDGKW